MGAVGVPLVSILVPAYRAERTLASTLESALSQTWPHVEVIVIDDGSPDGTLDVARAFEARGVTVRSQPNAGASVARNHALSLARGAFVQYLDADDLLSPDKISAQMEVLDGTTDVVAVSGTVYFQDEAGPDAGRDGPGYPALTSDDPVQWLLDLWTPGSGGYGPSRWGMVLINAWLTPRTVLIAAGPWDETITVDDDGEYFTRVLLASRGVRWAPDGRAYYRQYRHTDSLSSQSGPTHLSGRLRSIDSKAVALRSRLQPHQEVQAGEALARMYLDLAYHAHPAAADLSRLAEQRAHALGDEAVRRAAFRPFARSGLGSWVGRLAGWRAARRLSAFRHRVLR